MLLQQTEMYNQVAQSHSTQQSQSNFTVQVQAH